MQLDFVPQVFQRAVTINGTDIQGQRDRLPDLAAELARLQVDVIAASGPEATLRAASRATSTIPIVTMAVNYDHSRFPGHTTCHDPEGHTSTFFTWQPWDPRNLGEFEVSKSTCHAPRQRPSNSPSQKKTATHELPHNICYSLIE